MRSVIIPAQITTVEDRIAGNLSLTQIIILVVSLLLGMGIFAVLPPKSEVALYKIPFVITVFLSCSIMALRIRGKILLNWLIILFRYNLRPKYFVFNKNDLYLRDVYEYASTFEVTDSLAILLNKQGTPSPLSEFKIMSNLDPEFNPHFKMNKKGNLHVAAQ